MASDSEISCTNDPNFAVIYSFLKVFGKLYGLDVPTIAKFQEFIENTQEVLDPLKEIHLRLLRRALKSVQSNKWERSLIKFCHQHGHHQEAWEMERFSYKKASPQVKLKVLKLLLEYQFTCHPKFKSAVNALSCKDLRLDPIGRDKNGCVYWYQVDDDANLCLYKEDQDEETWQVVARNREELMKVITQLKNGEEVCPLVSSNTNEDSSSADIPPQIETKPEGDEENEEEFLSPESESEHEVEKEISKSPEKEEKKESTEPKEIAEEELNKEGSPEQKELKNETSKEKPDDSPLQENNKDRDQTENLRQEETVEDVEKEENETVSETIEEPVMIVTGEGNGVDCESYFNTDKEIIENITYFYENNIRNLESVKQEFSVSETVSEAIEEPLIFITGDGNGVDCDSPYIIGEEITEEIMYFFGEGTGYDNDTGNPETQEQEHSSAEENTDAENGNEECINGEHDVPNVTNNAKVVKSVKLKSGVTSVNKRTLKKQNNDTAEVLKSEPKKPCVRSIDPTDCTNSAKSAESATDSREGSVNDKSNTDTSTNDTLRKNNVKKGKVKKKRDLGNNLKLSEGKEIINSVTESDNCHDSKASIIEKRKSSVSSVEQEENDQPENEKEKSPDKDVKVEDPLPPKKLRLDTPESDVPGSVSNETKDNKNLIENKSHCKLKSKEEDVENSVSQRKKIKANKGKFKRKRILKIKAENDFEKEDSDNISVNEKKANKSLKRTLLDTTMSDKNKSESQSESEEDEPVTSGKRLKIKPKKIITSSRKKVEAKLREKHSSDESEEETLYSIAGKKSPKKVLKRKPKGKEKGKDKKKDMKGESGAKSEDSDAAPVRQSRRIAQMKIKEEADRRQLEEVALREMKMIHKKKNKDDDEEEWQASGSSSEGDKGRPRRRARDEWRGGDSTGPEPDSESDEPLFELHDEPDPLENTKSDHEFSPESDLESGEPIEPLKRARTLQEGKEDGVCARCGSGEQPEWILLCDQCDAGYHASCLKPMLFLVPEGDWYCPPCNHDLLITSLERELTKYDELILQVEAERERRKQEEPEKQSDDEKNGKEDTEDKSHSDESSSGWSSSSSAGAVYRLRARRQLPVSYRSQEYDRLISSAIKEEYVEPTTSAGNQGRGKDISTIIEAAEEEKMKAEREALEQGKPVEAKKPRKKARRKPRKLNSLEVPSEDDDTDEDFKETGAESSSEDISTSAERDSSSDSRSSDDLPIRRTARTDKKDRPKLAESSPDVKKKKKGVFEDSSSESADAKEWSKKEDNKKSKSKSRPKRDKSKKSRKRSGLTQYDAAGNVVRARVTYGGLSDDGPNDWSPKHRTRQKKINYTEMPNTESEDEMHKSSGKHMADSSDEFKVDDSELTSESDAERRAPDAAERARALSDLVCKTAVVPLEKLPDDVTRAKTEQLEEHLKAQQEALEAAAAARARGRGRGGRGRGARGRGRPATDDALAKLVGVKIKDLKTDGTPVKPNDIERAKKRQEREAKQAEKEARRVERLQKKEEKEKLKEQKAKEREEKKLARIALQESKRIKKEKVEFPMAGGYGPRPGGPGGPSGPGGPGPRLPFPHDFPDQRFPTQPRLQVRAELRGVAGPEERLHAVAALREGTLSVAGSPQPFKPVSEEPSIITRMPHMLNQQYRGPMMYPPGNSPYGPRGQNMMYPLHHPGMNPAARHQYPGGYYPPQMRAMPPSYPPTSSPGPPPHPSQLPPGHPAHRAPPGPHMPGGPHPPSGHMPGGPHPPNSHGMPPGHPLHGQLRPSMGPPGGPHGPLGPHGLHRPHPHGSPGPSSLGVNPHPHAGPASHMPNSPSPLAAPPGPSPLRPAHTPPASSASTIPSTTPAPATAEPLIKIKAEVKTEPEYRTPPASPRPPSPHDEPPRHPKIKHTENKDRRPRFPLGPYAPQYGPYGPYAPAPGGPADGHSPLLMQGRPAAPGAHPLQHMQQLQRLLPGADERARGPRPDLSYLSAHLRAARPPYFPPPERPGPAGAPQYSPYAELAAPPTMPLPPQQRERLSSPPGRSAPTPPGAAAAPPPASPVDPMREDRNRPPSAPRDSAASPYLKPNDSVATPYLKPSDTVAPPFLKPSDSVAPPYIKSRDTVPPSYLKPSDSVATPYLKPSGTVTPPYLKPNDSVAPPYLKPSDSVASPYLKPSDSVAPPYLKPSDTDAPPYLKPNDTAAPPYFKPSDTIAPPYLKPSDIVVPPYLKPSDAVAPPYLKPNAPASPPYAAAQEAPYAKPPAADKAPAVKAEDREEGSVFGGLVSYFSSQSQDDIDA